MFTRPFLLAALLALAACGAPAPQPVQSPITASTPSVPADGARISLLPNPRFEDFDPVDWPSRRPQAYPVHGIDVARYQGDIDWRKVRRAGVEFAFIKATEGGDFLDPKFADHRRGAKRAGLRWGAYHYFYFCRPAAEQARWFIRNVPRDASALPHVLDMEWNHRSPTCRKRPEGQIVRREARRFLDILERHYGKRPIVYTTPDFFKDTGIGRLRGTQFWLRSVADHPAAVYPGQRWVFWQYTGTGKIPGVSGPVDINVFAGSRDAWAVWPG